MNANRDVRGIQPMKLVNGILAVTLAATLGGPKLWAQATTADTKSGVITKTFYLNNVTESAEANLLENALRNMLDPHDKTYLDTTVNAIIVQASPDQIALAQKLLSDLDRPRKTYRLTYTLTEIDGGKRMSSQHFTMIVASGGKTSLKLGSRVPYATSGSGTAGSPVPKQYSYLDVGLNIDASLDESANGAKLRCKVEQSGFATAVQSNPADQKPDMDTQPVIRQATLEGTSYLTAGKPVMLGSLDVPTSTRHLDIEVLMEEVR